MLHLVVISPKKKEKRKEKKRNINNDLAILPSHDTLCISSCDQSSKHFDSFYDEP